MKFNEDLVVVVKRFIDTLSTSPQARADLLADPTGAIKKLLSQQGVPIPEPADEFHAHVIGAGDALPEEPDRATRERYIYVFHANGLFEFKVVPGSPTGDDGFMRSPKSACQCCNCCVLQVA